MSNWRLNIVNGILKNVLDENDREFYDRDGVVESLIIPKVLPPLVNMPLVILRD